MPNAKLDFCRRVRKNYGVLIDFDESCLNRTNVPRAVEGETFGQWKERLFGSKQASVQVFLPAEPAANTRMNTIIAKADVAHMEAVLRESARVAERRANAAIHTAKEKAEESARQARKKADQKVRNLRARADDDERKAVTRAVTEAIARSHDIEASLREMLEKAIVEAERANDGQSLIDTILRGYNVAVKTARSATIVATGDRASQPTEDE